MPKSTPFLLFKNKCAEAMMFYQQCFGGELILTKLADTHLKNQMPEELRDRITYAHLKNCNIDISATDWLHPARRPVKGNTVAVHVSGIYNKVKEVFKNLSKGATKELLDELRDMPFGLYGHFEDKYGIHWFFKGEKPEELQVPKPFYQHNIPKSMVNNL